MIQRKKTLSQFHQVQSSLCLETISPPVGPTYSVPHVFNDSAVFTC